MTSSDLNVWLFNTDPRFNTRAYAPAYLTAAQAARFNRICQARMLYRGDHYRYYVEEGRTTFNFEEEIVNGTRRKKYIAYNLLKRITHTSVDLLFGEEPLIRVEDEIAQEKITDLTDRTDLHAVLIELETECSFAGEGVLEVTLFDGEVYLGVVPAEQIHPIGIMRPDRQHAAYVRYAEENIGTAEKPIKLILATTYREGAIERRLYQDTVAERNRVALANWPAFKDAPPPDVQPTGIPFNTIIWFPNLMLGGQVISDYDGLLELQDALNAKQTKVSKVIDQHAEPNILAPRAAADDNGNLRATNKVLYQDKPDEWGYLTWDAQLAAAFQDRKEVVDAMCVVSETSPVLLGIDPGGAPESARALKLKANASLAKARRKATLRRPLLKWSMYVAQRLEQTVVGVRYNTATPTVEMRDGLPVDENEQAQTISLLTASDSISLERRVEMQIPDRDAAAQEIQRIRDQQAASQPSVFMTEPAATDSATGDANEKGTADAGVTATNTLNGAQITAAIGVIGQLQTGAIGNTTAVELLVAVGIERATAQAMVNESGSRDGAGNPETKTPDASTEVAQ
jgi:hypothetical protein